MAKVRLSPVLKEDHYTIRCRRHHTQL